MDVLTHRLLFEIVLKKEKTSQKENTALSFRDSVWKEAIKTFFEEFLWFFFPQIAKEIAFEAGYEFLDKELDKIVQDAEVGKRFADMLAKVYLKNGEETWLLIHIEVQGYYEKEFALRMFIYNYRIFDRYKKPVVSLAILADTKEGFRPHEYCFSFGGFEQRFRFPVVKLLDYKERWEELEASKNPFAVIVMTHLKEQETKGDYDKRLFWKIKLVKELYKRGYRKEEILLLYKFIDWLVSLPKELNEEFHKEIIRYEEEKKMPYITTAERIGIEKGIKIGIQQGIKQGIQQGIKQGLLKAIELGLELKFGAEGLRIYPEIKKIKDIDVLEAISEAIKQANTLAEIERIYKDEKN